MVKGPSIIGFSFLISIVLVKPGVLGKKLSGGINDSKSTFANNNWHFLPDLCHKAIVVNMCMTYSYSQRDSSIFSRPETSGNGVSSSSASNGRPRSSKILWPSVSISTHDPPICLEPRWMQRFINPSLFLYLFLQY